MAAVRAQGCMATDREIAETMHCLEHSKKAFRLMVRRWPNPQQNLFAATPYCYHAVATNRERVRLK